ncbi:complement resistance protein TraT [Sulfurimonas sp.]|uniref:complement resistance protein TraT n=1 Tax=Sulfurimonas sp. TaxID=2022749 RepID=UPI00260E1B4B|nr:complement resistance protein TraT [Sulfurimonas sp.]
MKQVTKIVLASIAIVGLVGLSGCSAMKTAVAKRNLDVQTKMSDTVFLEPVAPEDKIIYFDMRNTSDRELNVAQNIRNIFEKKGFVITNNPKKATYMLQGNVLKATKTNAREAEALKKSAYGSAIVGGLATGAAAKSMGANSGQTAGYALLGAGLGFVGDALVEDTIYVMVTDLQIRERPLEGEIVTQTQQAHLKQGLATNTEQYAHGGKVQWKTYRTRIISTAEKMNLDFSEAKPALEKALSRSISGIF